MATLAEDFSIEQLEQVLHAADPAALLVPSRILRRVIKQDRQISGIGLRVPHRKSYVISSERLLEFVERSELAIPNHFKLPSQVLLLSRPEADKLSETPVEQTLLKHWRLLFHARIDALLDQRRISPQELRQRIQRIGHTEFDEIRSVLKQEDFLLPPRTDSAIYHEFVAVYLELRYFNNAALAAYFPALRDLAAIDALIAEDVDADHWFAATRLSGAPLPVAGMEGEGQTDVIVPQEPAAISIKSELRYHELTERAAEASRRGNQVRAAILRTRAACAARVKLAEKTRADAAAELETLTRRLQAAVGIDTTSAAEWQPLLVALVERADQGIWTPEARLLFDLQKVCVDHERGVYKLDLPRWLLSAGRRPLKRPLPSQREVLMSKHLRAAAQRLRSVRIIEAKRGRLRELLQAAMQHAEERLRERFRPLINQALTAVGLEPVNLPETVARRKVVEELLDRIVDRGFLTMGDLRDALSRNSLKMADLASVQEFVQGDQLLRADRQMATLLDGVYRRGEVYLRWPQRLSSLAFGTWLGRTLTQFVVLPFGGAYLILGGVDHAAEKLMAPAAPVEATGAGITAASSAIAAAAEPISHAMDGALAADAAHHAQHVAIFATTPWVLAVGLFLAGLIHLPAFRRACLSGLQRVGQGLRWLVIDLPLEIARLPIVRALFETRFFMLLARWLIKPGIITALILGAIAVFTWRLPATANIVAVFLTVNLLINSRVGRNVDELITDWLARGWHHLRIRVFAAIYRFIMESFHRLVEASERVLYTVDEWLRFRSGESQLTMGIKACLGVVWFMVTYVIRFCINLLIEPQVNPIKHFPVVTVSHKILLPLTPTFIAVYDAVLPLTPSVCATLAIVTVFVLPGVFGYLVWELKENWRLYAANRPHDLQPVLIGSHGETMMRLMRPGFHSGTLPKLFGRLRRAGRKAVWTGNWKASRKFHDALAHVEESIRRFVERELIVLLEKSGRMGPARVSLGHIHLASNQVLIELRCTDLSADSLWLAFEHHSGWLLAGIAQRGWLARVSATQAAAFRAAIAGLYKMAGVDLVREQIEAVWAPRHPDYDIADAGLVVYWRAVSEQPTVYHLRDTSVLLRPAGDSVVAEDAPVLERWKLMLAEMPLDWQSWVATWQPDARQRDPLPSLRLLPGTRDVPAPASDISSLGGRRGLDLYTTS